MPVPAIRNLIKKRKVICTENCKMAVSLKELSRAFKKHGLILINSQKLEKNENFLNKKQPISREILLKIATYPSCLQANLQWAELSCQHRTQLLDLWIPKLEKIAIQSQAILEFEKPDAVLTFQGYTPEDAILRIIATQQRIPNITIENTMRTDRLAWETISGITVNKNQAALHYWKHQDTTSADEIKQGISSYLSTIKDLKKNNEHQSPSRQFKWNTTSKKILFLGQVYTDASMIYGLNNFKTPIELIGLLLAWLEKNDHSLIIKLHPKEHTGKNPVTQNSYANITHRLILKHHSDKIERLGQRIILDSENKYDTYNLIEQSDLVATVNSQAGLEAAIMGKSVIHGRQCFYGGLDFTYEYQDKLDFELRLNRALADGPKNVYAAQKFFYIFFEKYCIEKNPNALAQLIKSI